MSSPPPDPIDLNADASAPDAPHRDEGDEVVIPQTEAEGSAMEDEDIVPKKQADDEPLRYRFPSDKKREFSVSDLVWGKVKCHPWWPGQIVDASCASELALKHRRRENHLVAYFADKTFAWCDASQLKHLSVDFPAMERQSWSEAFVDAVKGALEEVSRRVESGLVCGCLPKEVRSRLEFGGIENSGIKEGVKVMISNGGFGLTCFRPDEFIGYVRSLALSPLNGVDRFGLTMAKAQLLAYSRSKGFTDLPDVYLGKGLVDESSEIYQSEDGAVLNSDGGKLSGSVSKKAHQKSGSGSHHKRKSASEDGRKLKRLSELMDDSGEVNLENGSDASSDKMLKAARVETEKYKRKKLEPVSFMETKSPTSVPYKSFKVGECILRVASRLTNSPSVKSNDEVTQKSNERRGHGDGSPFSLEDCVPSSDEAHENETSIMSCLSLDELLSQLCTAAMEPLEAHDLSPTMIGFFTGYARFCAVTHRNSVNPVDQSVYEMDIEKETSSSVSREDFKAPEEIMQKSKELPSPVSGEEMKSPEEGRRKRGRPPLNNADDPKEHVRIPRKRGRPHHTLEEDSKLSMEISRRKGGHTASSSAEGEKPSDENPRKHGRQRSKPAVVVTLFETPEHGVKPHPGYSENAKTPEVVKRKRGRPPKVRVNPADLPVHETGGEVSIPETDVLKMTPAYMNDSYWTDVVICNIPEKRQYIPVKKERGRKKKQFLIQNPEPAEKPVSEPTEFQSPTGPVEPPKEIQVPSVSPPNNTYVDFLSERRISYFGEKCVNESNPTAFVLNFTDSNSIPSEAELVRIFSRYGPLKDAETEVQKHLSCAKVVFKRRADAEVAFANARKYNFFGHALLSFRLRSTPSVADNSPAHARLCSNSPLSACRNTGTVAASSIEKAEDSEVKELSSLNHNLISEREYSGDVNHCAMEILDAEVGGTLVDSVEFLPSDQYQVASGCGNVDIVDTRECSASLDASFRGEEGQDNSKDAHNLKKDGLSKIQSSERDASGLVGDGKANAAVVEEPSITHDFDMPIPGNAGDFDEVKTPHDYIMADKKESNALGALEAAKDEALVEDSNVGIQEAGIVDKPACDAKLEVSDIGRIEEDSDNQEVERLGIGAGSDVCNMIIQGSPEHGSIGVRSADAFSVTDDGAVQTSEISWLPDRKCLGIPYSGMGDMPCGQFNLEALAVVGGYSGKEGDEHPHITILVDMGASGDTNLASAEVVTGSTEEKSSEDDCRSEVEGTSGLNFLDGDRNAVMADDGAKVEDGIMKFPQTEKSISDDHILEAPGIVDAPYREKCGSVPTAGSEIELAMQDGMITEVVTTVSPETEKPPLFNDIHIPEAVNNEDAREVGSCGGKFSTPEICNTHDCEKHLEGSIDEAVTDDLHLDARMVDSLGANALEYAHATCETIFMDNESQGTSELRLDTMEVDTGMVSDLDNEKDGIIETSNIKNSECGDNLDLSISKTEASVGDGLVPENIKDDSMAASPGIAASDSVTDGTSASKLENVLVDCGLVVPVRQLIENADSSCADTHVGGTKESLEFGDHLDPAGCKTDNEHMCTGSTEDSDNKMDQTAGVSEPPDCTIGLKDFATYHVEVLVSHQDDLELKDGVLPVSLVVTESGKQENDANILEVSGTPEEASMSKTDDVITDVEGDSPPIDLEVGVTTKPCHAIGVCNQGSSASTTEVSCEHVEASLCMTGDVIMVTESSSSGYKGDEVVDTTNLEASDSMPDTIPVLDEQLRISDSQLEKTHEDEKVVGSPNTELLGILDASSLEKPDSQVDGDNGAPTLEASESTINRAFLFSKADEVINSANLETVHNMTDMIVHNEQLNFFDSQSNCGDDEMVGDPDNKVNEILNASNLEDHNSHADEDTSISILEVSLTTEAQPVPDKHPWISGCQTETTFGNVPMVSSPHTEIVAVQSASLVDNQGNGTDMALGCNIRLKALAVDTWDHPRCRDFEDPAMKDEQIANACILDGSDSGVNIKHSESCETGVLVDNGAADDANAETIEMKDGDKSEIHDGSAGLSHDYDKYPEALVKDVSMSTAVTENLDIKPDGTADPMNMDVPSNSTGTRLIPAEDQEASVSECNIVNGEEVTMQGTQVEVAASTYIDAHNQLDVSDKHSEDMVLQTDTENVSVEAPSTVADHLVHVGNQETSVCESQSMSVPIGQLGILFCKTDDQLVNESQNSAEVGEKAGNLDGCDGRVDVALESDSSDLKIETHRDASNMGLHDKTDIACLNYININVVQSCTEYQGVPVCKTGDIGSDIEVTNPHCKGNEISESTNLEALNSE